MNPEIFSTTGTVNFSIIAILLLRTPGIADIFECHVILDITGIYCIALTYGQAVITAQVLVYGITSCRVTINLI